MQTVQKLGNKPQPNLEPGKTIYRDAVISFDDLKSEVSCLTLNTQPGAAGAAFLLVFSFLDIPKLVFPGRECQESSCSWPLT